MLTNTVLNQYFTALTLKRVYSEDLVVDEANEERGQLRGRDEERILI